MPLIHRIGGLTVYIYASPREHPPPHFHLVGPDTNASIDIETHRVTGTYRRRDMAEVLDWAAKNTDFLLAKWSEFNERD